MQPSVLGENVAIVPSFHHNKDVMYSWWTNAVRTTAYKTPDETIMKIWYYIEEVIDELGFFGWDQIWRAHVAIEKLSRAYNFTNVNRSLVIMANFFAYMHYDPFNSDGFVHTATTVEGLLDSCFDMFSFDVAEICELIAGLSLPYDCVEKDFNVKLKVLHDAQLIWYTYPQFDFAQAVGQQIDDFKEDFPLYRELRRRQNMEMCENGGNVFWMTRLQMMYNSQIHANLREEPHLFDAVLL